jgi:hypothetical protein
VPVQHGFGPCGRAGPDICPVFHDFPVTDEHEPGDNNDQPDEGEQEEENHRVHAASKPPEGVAGMTRLGRNRGVRNGWQAVGSAAAGFAFTLLVFYPGIMTHDAGYVYDAIGSPSPGDWQSPVMTLLWALVDPLAPGPASLFLLTAALYWTGFGTLAFALSRSGPVLALLLPAAALLPPAFVFVGILWRDVLFATVWLAASAVGFVAGGARPGLRTAMTIVALALVVLGVLLRPNGVIAAPVLVAAILWPQRLSLSRLVLAYLPVAFVLAGLVQLVYYGLLDAKRQHPEQSVMVFDLGGMSHYAGDNRLPGSWTAAQDEAIRRTCYRPTEWDIYWWREPCRFVMEELERNGLFGSPDLSAAWRNAVLDHPLAYLRHRLAYAWNFLAQPNLTMFVVDIAKGGDVFADHPLFNAIRAVHDGLKPTLLFRPGVWLLGCIVVATLGWRQRATRGGVLAIGLAGSAVLYVLSFAALGVASDFRYGYWAVLATLAGGAACGARCR